MQHIATNVARSVVCLSVCLSVCLCWSHGGAVHKRLNRSRCRWGLTHVGKRNHVLNGV